MTLLVKPISQLPVATTSTGTDNLVVNHDNGDSTFTTERITATNFLTSNPVIVNLVQGNKVNLTHASSPYTMQPSDEFLICDTSDGNIVIDLVGATLHKLPGVTVLMTVGTGQVSTVANGSDTIIGGGPIAFLGQAYVYKSNLISKWYAT